MGHPRYVRFARLLPSLSAFLVSANVFAIGSVSPDPPASTMTTHLRALHAGTGSTQALWLSGSLDGAADQLVWVIPVSSEASVDQASSVVFDALEDSTAPRVVPTQLSCAKTPEATVVTLGPFPAPTPAISYAKITTMQGLSGTLAGWKVTLSTKTQQALSKELGEGKILLALRLEPAPGTSSLPTVRVAASEVAMPFVLLEGADGNVDGTFFAAGPGLASLPGLKTTTLSSNPLAGDAEGSNYLSVRKALLDAGQVVLESSSRTTLTHTGLVSGVVLPSVLDGMLVRASALGELSSDLGVVSDAVHLSMRTNAAMPCSRGDFIGVPCKGTDALAKWLGPASDIAFLAANDATQTTITRFAFRVSGETGFYLPLPTYAAGDEVPIVRKVQGPDVCSPSTGGGGMTGGTNPGTGGHGGTSLRGDPEDGTTEDTSSAQANVDVGCQGTTESCSSDSGSDGGDSCAKDSSGSSDSGCSGNESAGDSCSGNESAGDSCSGGEGSSSSCSGSGDAGGGSSCDCAIPKKRPKRPFHFVFLALALAFPFRRLTRPKNYTGS